MTVTFFSGVIAFTAKLEVHIFLPFWTKALHFLSRRLLQLVVGLYWMAISRCFQGDDVWVMRGHGNWKNESKVLSLCKSVCQFPQSLCETASSWANAYRLIHNVVISIALVNLLVDRKLAKNIFWTNIGSERGFMFIWLLLPGRGLAFSIPAVFFLAQNKGRVDEFFASILSFYQVVNFMYHCCMYHSFVDEKCRHRMY